MMEVFNLTSKITASINSGSPILSELTIGSDLTLSEKADSLITTKVMATSSIGIEEVK